MDEPLLTITTQEDAVELVLTREQVIMKLSEKIVQEARGEIHADPNVQAPGLGGSILRFITGAAEKMMGTTIAYPLDDIEAVNYRDGSLVFTYRKKRHLNFDEISIVKDGAPTPALAAFAPTDAQNFVQRFAEVKARSV